MKTGAELLWYAEQAPKFLEEISLQAELANPQCGDLCVVQVWVDAGLVRAISVRGQGCAVCRAVGGWLQETVVDVQVEEILAWRPLYAVTSWNLSLGPLRQKCAKLPVETLLKALHVSFQLEKRNIKA
jgi:NifU-like protein involved in Fe-S cluster formation